MNDHLPNSDKDLKSAWRAAELIAKYIQKETSGDEEAELNQWRQSSTHNEDLFIELTSDENVQKAKDWLKDTEVQKAKVYEQLKSKITFSPPRRSPNLNLWWIAASLIVFIATSAVIYFNNKSPYESSSEKIVKSADVGPGQNSAILELSDGSRVDLNNIKPGIIPTKEVTVINNTGGGMISYSDTSAIADNLFNTLTTPIGGQYTIELPDGSKAWLNAASSLKYPLSFKHGRTVEATGEVYFEVKKDKFPFIVKIKDASVEVLGTHFNVNAYSITQTTLLEGSVQFSNNNEFKILKPGEMGIAGGNILVRKLEYPEDEVAWKNGYFRFSKTGIKDIMVQLARWYKIDVAYEGNFEGVTFTATAKRNENISSILNNIQKTGHIHFKIEGMKVTVLP